MGYSRRQYIVTIVAIVYAALHTIVYHTYTHTFAMVDTGVHVGPTKRSAPARTRALAHALCY